MKKTRGVTDFWIAQPAKLSTFLVRHHLSLTAGVLRGLYWRKQCTDLKKKKKTLAWKLNIMGWRFPMVSQIKKKNNYIWNKNQSYNCNNKLQLKQTCQLFSTCQAHCESRPFGFEVAINMLFVQRNISVKRFCFFF